MITKERECENLLIISIWLIGNDLCFSSVELISQNCAFHFSTNIIVHFVLKSNYDLNK